MGRDIYIHKHIKPKHFDDCDQTTCDTCEEIYNNCKMNCDRLDQMVDCSYLMCCYHPVHPKTIGEIKQHIKNIINNDCDLQTDCDWSCVVYWSSIGQHYIDNYDDDYWVEIS